MKPSTMPPPPPWTGIARPGSDGDDDVTDHFFRWLGGGLLAAHGLIHLMGMQLLWKMGEPAQLSYADAYPTPGSAAAWFVGGLWALAAFLFVVSALLLVSHRLSWRAVALASVVVSVAVLGLAPSLALAGLATDAVVLLVVAALVYHDRHPRTLPG